MRDFHTAIIGAGSGGLTVAVGLASFGKEVALIEKDHVGGDCTNVGCVPSKTLIHLAKQLKTTTLSPVEVLEQVRKRRDELRDEETKWMENSKNITLIKAEARFNDAHTLELRHKDGRAETLQAKHIVISTGSSPVSIPIEGLPKEKILTNESLFDLTELPPHLAIIGAGIIGCEMAFALRNLGCEVSLLDLAPRILGVLEPEVSELMQARLEATGIKVYTQTKAKHFDPASTNLMLDQNGDELKLQNVKKVLMAIGRKPQLELSLDKAGVKSEKRGIPTNALHQTNVPHIYAIGDVNLKSAFTHSANAQGRRVVPKIALPFLPQGKEPLYPSATFTDPEIAQVGPRLEDLQKQWPAELIKTYRINLEKTDRGYTQFFTKEDGFVLIHVLRLSGRVLSASIVAPNASEMISPLTLAVNNGISMYKLANLVFPYPSLSEAIKKAADAFVFETLPKLPQELIAYLSKRFIRP